MGRVSQVAGMRRYRLEEGRADGMNAVEVRTGGGLDFTVYPSRAMDIGQATFRGVPLAWISQVGPSSPCLLYTSLEYSTAPDSLKDSMLTSLR